MSAAPPLDILTALGWQDRRPVGRTHGAEYAGPCPHCGGGRDRLRAWPLRKPRPGFWCRRCGWKGTDLTLARELGGALPAMREEAPPPAPSYTPIALRIWNEATDSTGTSTQEYLASRAITAPLPPSIRHHAHLLHKPSALHLPAMVAAVAGADGEIVGIHRTYITPDGSGKADVDPPRMMLGACAGAAVWMALPAPVMAVAEGIETALSVWQATGIATWAVMSTTGLELVNLPALPMASEVVIAADGDAPGRAAADRAARRFTSEGRRVRIAHPPEGLDFNDLAQREGNQHDDD